MVKLVLFFVFMTAVYVFLTMATTKAVGVSDFSSKMYGIFALSTAIFVLTTYGAMRLFDVDGDKQEAFLYQTTPAKKCSLGPYTWQGDSETAKMCRELASTPEGRAEIAKYQCGKGYVGQPGGEFVYTPDSDAEWQNARCQ